MKKNPVSQPTQKTVVICGDDKGGVTKSASCINVADGLRQFGYSVLLGDGDEANRTLSELDPTAVELDGRSESALDKFLGDASASSQDIVLLDMPGSSGHILRDYFGARGFEAFQEMGLRLVVAMTLTETDDAVKGVLSWVETFLEKAEFIIFANHRDTADGRSFDVEKLTAGQEILAIAEKRIIEIPRFSQCMLQQYNAVKAAPSAYLANGRACNKLKLNALQSILWATHLKKVTRSLYPHISWLTGMTPPIVPDSVKTEGSTSESANSVMARLRSTVEERIRSNSK